MTSRRPRFSRAGVESPGIVPEADPVAAERFRATNASMSFELMPSLKEGGSSAGPARREGEASAVDEERAGTLLPGAGEDGATPFASKRKFLPFVVIALALAVISGVVLWVVGGGGGGGEASSSADTPTRLYSDYWASELSFSPETATFYGIAGDYNAQLSNMTVEAADAQTATRRQLLDRANSLLQAEQSAADVLSLRVLQQRLQYDLRLAPFRGYLMPVDQMDGVHLFLAQLASMTELRTPADCAAYVGRLQQVPRFFNQTAELMRIGISVGLTKPRVRRVGGRVGAARWLAHASCGRWRCRAWSGSWLTRSGRLRRPRRRSTSRRSSFRRRGRRRRCPSAGRTC